MVRCNLMYALCNRWIDTHTQNKKKIKKIQPTELPSYFKAMHCSRYGGKCRHSLKGTTSTVQTIQGCANKGYTLTIHDM